MPSNDLVDETMSNGKRTAVLLMLRLSELRLSVDAPCASKQLPTRRCASMLRYRAKRHRGTVRIGGCRVWATGISERWAVWAECVCSR